MISGYRAAAGFTLIELVAVLVLTAILSGVAISRTFSNSAFELQATRGLVVSTLRTAQQLAMNQTDSVRFSTSGNRLNILRSGAALDSFNGLSLPIVLPSSQSITAASFDFDRLGRTSASSLLLSQESMTVTITVSEAGHVE